LSTVAVFSANFNARPLGLLALTSGARQHDKTVKR
jgi:hypothetical protein